MLLFTAAALAAVNLGYPCSRLNWAWRNVWSTCSINSYIPTNADGDVIASHYRKYPVNEAANEDFGAPTNILAATGVMAPQSGAAGVPSLLCVALTSGTGGAGPHAALRNRCRRAIDAYGGLARLCRLEPAVVSPGMYRGPIQVPAGNAVLGDWEPAATHEPHWDNVQALYAHARHCTEEDWPGTYKSPATTCPGLLGWFTVVWHACKFDTEGPNVGATGDVVAPLGEHVHPKIFWDDEPLQDSPSVSGSPTFIFCNPIDSGLSPNTWFERPPALNTVNRPFRSTRCRKALDQLGRTASRCGLDTFGSTTAPWTGAKDQLMAFLKGSVGTSPLGFLHLAPLCN